MMGDETLGLMQELTVFKGFTAPELDILSSVFRTRRFRKGEFLCKEGDAYASFFVVAAGEVMSYRRITDERRLELGVVGKDTFLGQKSLIDGKRRSATMEAIQPTVVLECSREDFQRLFNANSPFAYKMLDFVVTDLTDRLRGADKVFDRMLSDPGRTLSTVLDALSEAGGLLGGAEEPPDDGPKKYYVDV